jgi:hypothetical protein
MFPDPFGIALTWALNKKISSCFYASPSDVMIWSSKLFFKLFCIASMS